MATLRPRAETEGVPDVALPTVDEAEDKLRQIGARGACNAALDDDRALTRAETVISCLRGSRAGNPSPAHHPSVDALMEETGQVGGDRPFVESTQTDCGYRLDLTDRG